ncbi:unnamed protein product [Phytophthora fragariaefolia]|uniref:Unnamed protein product n=1 Tax=Phytophthora fragariaefolia TaxID=1490495 RepID=A0A9W6Y091_9STRA|nr:unnamed protein product [Phytophthora fragariaefolia]
MDYGLSPVGYTGASTDSIPLAAQVFLGLATLHESYFEVPLCDSTFAASVVIHGYPYFRLNVTVFAEREISKLAKKTSDVDDDSTCGAQKLKVIASKTVEVNDASPFVKPIDSAMFAFQPHGVLLTGHTT